MKNIYRLDEALAAGVENVGGKAMALSRMLNANMNVPSGLAIAARAYQGYVRETGLQERILLELNRKRFEDMRWEEMWDASLRIRNMFLNTPIPEELANELTSSIAAELNDRSTVVRSSALAEDTAGASFAGLHESYVNVRGTPEIIEHVRLVWASLWSDAALLYRKELGLDVATSAMAVVVQEIVEGDVSGVAFSKDPTGGPHAIIEAVHGLNEGLVDGTVEPDHWVLERDTGAIQSHIQPPRKQAVRPMGQGTELVDLPSEQAEQVPLSEHEVQEVLSLVLTAERLFGGPQDVEWTRRDEQLYVLQARPITTGHTEEDDQRSWYMTLRRSFDNLSALRVKIEEELIPQMIAEGERLAAMPVISLSDAELAAEIDARAEILQKWHDIYWAEFIPFAHGARLFGQVYNDAVRPEDPFEFMGLLAGAGMESMQRNQLLDELTEMARKSPDLLDVDALGVNEPFRKKLEELAAMLGPHGIGEGTVSGLVALVRQASQANEATVRANRLDSGELIGNFITSFPEAEREWAEELLDLARASYRLRDDDNVYFGRIEAALADALAEGYQRIGASRDLPADLSATEMATALRDPAYTPSRDEEVSSREEKPIVRPRQLIGQPAGPGLVTGAARVIASTDDLFDFKADEILVCDAIDPNMTFVVPLCAGIVERRGGMLIHGAIIAREYGLPCVTGVPDATDLIHTGDTVTVDGYLGIVVIGS